MNQSKVYSRRNEILSKFKNLTGSYSNTIKINPHNSAQHELKKFSIALELIKAGVEVFTEIELKKGGVCDILGIDRNGDALIFEIINTESKESIENKREIYPFTIIEVKA